MGLYRMGATKNPGYDRISIDIIELYLPVHRNHENANIPMNIDIEEFDSAFGFDIMDERKNLDESSLKKEHDKFVREHFP